MSYFKIFLIQAELNLTFPNTDVLIMYSYDCEEEFECFYNYVLITPSSSRFYCSKEKNQGPIFLFLLRPFLGS